MKEKYSVRLEPELKDAATEKAKEQGINFSEFVRRVLSKTLKFKSK